MRPPVQRLPVRGCSQLGVTVGFGPKGDTVQTPPGTFSASIFVNPVSDTVPVFLEHTVTIRIFLVHERVDTLFGGPLLEPWSPQKKSLLSRV